MYCENLQAGYSSLSIALVQVFGEIVFCYWYESKSSKVRFTSVVIETRWGHINLELLEGSTNKGKSYFFCNINIR